MEKRQHRQIYLAQNFLKSPKLVRRLVGLSSIRSSDAVYEIGAGKGIITAELVGVARQVVAIEKDPRLARRLCERFRALDNVEIIEKDFLSFSIPADEYKIFASIPYNITASIVRKILYVRPVPREAYLILQNEAARKFSGFPKETLFSILAKPFFEFKILSELRRTDFDPMPNVDSVFLCIKRRLVPLIQAQDVSLYRDFVQYGFGRWKPNLKLAFKHLFTYKQWKRLARDLSFQLNATPTELNFEQWLGLYHYFKKRSGYNG